MEKIPCFIILGILVILSAFVAYKLLWTVAAAQARTSRRAVRPHGKRKGRQRPAARRRESLRKGTGSAAEISTPGYFPVAQRSGESPTPQRSGFFPARLFTRLVRRAEPGLCLAQRGQLPGLHLHQQPQARRTLHRRRRFPDAGRSAFRPGLSSPRPMRPPANKSGAPISTTANVTGHWIGNANLNILPQRQHRLRLGEPDRAHRRRHRTRS